jgi:hypothetical protein
MLTWEQIERMAREVLRHGAGLEQWAVSHLSAEHGSAQVIPPEPFCAKMETARPPPRR